MMKDQYGVEFSDDGKSLIKAPKDIITYEIPNGVTVISAYAFKDCGRIARITIPSSVVDIKTGAFNGCSSLSSLNYEGTIKSWCNINWEAFVVCAYDLFINNILVSEITLPESTKEIKKNTFYFCRSLKKITFNKSLIKIDAFAFSKSGLVGSIMLPCELKQVMKYAFFNCSSITEITIPDKVTEFYFGAVSACYALLNIAVSEQNEVYKSVGGVLYNKKTGTLCAFPTAKYKNGKFELPSWVKNIASDAFCYSTLPNNGLVIKHNLSSVVEGAFREAVGKVYVPVGQKENLVKFNVPEKIIQERFYSEYAFNPGHSSVTAISENPYRILGTYANAPMKEIIANATKIKRFLEVGKNVEFPTDCIAGLPKVIRTVETVEDALNKIKLPENRLMYAFFWLFNSDRVEGKIALELINTSNLDKSLELYAKLLERSNNPLYRINESIVVCLKQNYFDGVWTLLCKSVIYFDDIVKCVLNDEITIDEQYKQKVYNSIVDALLFDFKEIDLWLLMKEDKESEVFDRIMYKKIIDERIKLINSEISKVNQTNNTDIYATVLRLKDNTNEAITIIRNYLSKDNPERIMITDALSNQILQCAIDYYNNSLNRPEIVYKVLDLMTYSEMIADSTLKKERCRHNIEIIKDFIATLPPQKVAEYDNTFKSILKELSELKSHIITDYIGILKKISTPVQKIRTLIEGEVDKKEKEAINKFLNTVCTTFIDRILNNIVEIVNASIKNYSSETKSVLGDAWNITILMEKFPMEKEFKEKRFLPNKFSLNKLCKNGIPYGYTTYSSLLCATIDLRTENELWQDCLKNQDYSLYISRFPDGKYVKEAKNEQSKRDEEDSRSWKNCSSEQDFKTYCNKYPKGLHIEEARDKLKRIEKESKVLSVLIWIMIIILIPLIAYHFWGVDGIGGVGAILLFGIFGLFTRKTK